jgi:putative hydrolase of the HAD superfamily
MIKGLIFDLDNTLYPHSSGIEDKVFRRMLRFSADHLGISVAEVERLRKTVSYGTTLEWLITEHDLLDVEGYFAEIHPEGEEDGLTPNPRLVSVLASTRLPKVILTNSPMEHALRIVRRLGVEDAFTSIVDIRRNRLKGKPHPEAYLTALKELGCQSHEAVLFDDYTVFLEGFIRIGGHAVLVDEAGTRAGNGYLSIKTIFEYPRIVSTIESRQ